MLEYGRLTIENHDTDIANLKQISEQLRSKLDESQEKGTKNDHLRGWTSIVLVQVKTHVAFNNQEGALEIGAKVLAHPFEPFDDLERDLFATF
mmetsp:Transcript_17931/g.22506  ORF Transcript_17931/g.22506 Transcript_17931/m.22506 type:complete len:93 (-) Transcript_17931:318-596(-)